MVGKKRWVVFMLANCDILSQQLLLCSMLFLFTGKCIEIFSFFPDTIFGPRNIAVNVTGTNP